MKRLTCMTKRLFYALLFVMMIWMPSYVQAAGETKTLQDTNPGDEITFAGQQWIVLEPEEGYIFAKEAIGSRAFDPESNQFDPTSSENIGYYLNVDYWGSLSLAEQRVIQDREWTLDDFDVQYAPVVAKVGLLSFFEWGKYREDDVIANPSAPMWLRTPTGSDSFVVITHPNGSNQGLIVSYPVDVLPALALETALLLSETNEVLLPEVSFAPNGMENWEKKHTTEIEVSDIYNQIEQLQYQWSTSIETPAESGWSDFANRDTISTPAGAVGEHYLHVRGIDADKQVVMSDVSEVFKLVQQIEDMNQGAEINFAGRGWIVLEPEEGYIFAKESLGMIPFAPTDTAKFDPMERNSLAHYLNTEYYEGLTAGEQAVIQNTIWDIADFYPPVTAKIGLLSEAEWNKYGNRSGSRVISRTPLGDMWLRTSSSPWLQAYVSSWHGGIMPGIPDTPQAVYPTLTLPPNLYIADSQEVFFTEVDFTSNGNSKWAPQHTTEVTVHNDLTEVFDIQYAWSTNTTKPEDGWKSLDSDSDSIQTPTDISGVFYLHVQGQETLGGTFHRVSKAFHVDDIEPELSVEMLAGDELYEDDTWINQEVTVSIEAIDENIEILVITQNGEEITDIEGFQHHLDFTASGTYQLEITAADKADNQTNVIRTIHIDQDPPDPPTIELDPSDWTNKDNVIVTISDGADQESGVDRTEYRIEENDWESYEEAFEITKEGETLIEARTIDQAGNVSDTAQSIVKIDRVAPDAPVITLDPSGWTNKEEVLVTITSGEDQGSGVALIEYRIAEEKDWKTYQEAFSMAEEGETGIYARVVDQIGNVSDVVQETVKIDHTAPEITLNGETEITIELGGSYEEVGATAQDNFDGDVSNRIKITGSVNTSKIGTYQLTYTVKDSAGNNTSIPRTVHVEDTTVPTDISIEAAEVTTDSVMFTFAAKDLGGIREYILSRDGEEIARVDGSGTTYTDEKVQAGTTYLYELTAIDFSDNAAAVEIEITTEQKPAPGAPVTVEYVDEAGNSLAEAEELIGNIGEIYQTAAKKIEGYQLMKEPDNADGKYTEKAQTVTYVYAPGKEDQAPGARVTVKHVDEDGTELLPVEELTGNKGDFYQTFPAHIAGYEVIQIPDNTAGEFTNEAQTVIYVYVLVEGESEGTIIIEYVDEAGNSIAGRESQTGPVGEIYETKPKTIVGYQLVQTPDNAAGKFTEETQTITYIYASEKEGPTAGAPVTVTYVDEDGNNLIAPETFIGNVGETYETKAIQINGYEIIQMPDNAAGEFTNEAQTVIYVYASVEGESEGTIIIEYVDEAGNSIAGRESQTGPVGEIYETKPKTIAGYQLVQTPDNAAGKFTEEIQLVKYVYALDKVPMPGAAVTVKHVEEKGNELIPAEELTGNLGDFYQTYPATIDGYEVVLTPENAAGKFTDETQTVKYVYAPVEKKPEGALIIEYVDEAGNSVAGKESRSGPVGEIYKTEPKAIKGYRLIQEPDNATGEFMKEVQTITYVYAPVKKELKPGAPVTVNYVDEEGKELIPSEELTGNLGDSYQTIGKRMEGYQLIQIPDNAIGKFTEKAQSVTYVYVPEKSAELNEPETIEIILDQPPVEVFPGIMVFIKGTQTIIQLPADLPMGTLLQVHSIEAEQQDGLEQAGEVYDFLFTYPESDKGYMGDFILTMGVDGDSEQAAIYHYQKGSEKWEWIGGTIDARTITASVSHFSAYGVFEAEKGLEEEPAPRKEKEKAEEEEKGSSSKNQSGVAAQGVTQAGNPNGMGETASQLPSTAANQYIWLLAGVLLIVLGSGFVSIRKKRKQM